jgi:hypothetical protein
MCLRVEGERRSRDARSLESPALRVKIYEDKLAGEVFPFLFGDGRGFDTGGGMVSLQSRAGDEQSGEQKKKRETDFDVRGQHGEAPILLRGTMARGENRKAGCERDLPARRATLFRI